MREPSLRKLSPVFSDVVKQYAVRAVYGSRSGDFEYVGQVIRSEAAPVHDLEFQVVTGMLRRATLTIPVAVRTDATAVVSVNGAEVRTVALPGGASSPRLTTIVVDVTPHVAKVVTSNISLHVQMVTGSAELDLLDMPGSDRLAVTQPWAWPHAMVAGAFIVLSMTVIAAMAIYGVASVHAADFLFRSFAVLTIVAGWLLGVLGLPDLVKVPVVGILRRLYGVTYRRRVAAVMLLALATPWAAFLGVDVVVCLWGRYRYTADISKAMETYQDPEESYRYVRRAFLRIPQRTEAQLLFERRATALRTESTRPAFKAYVRTFVTDPAVEAAVRRAGARSRYLSGEPLGEEAMPQFWYATILPEAEVDRATEMKEKAADLLNGFRTPAAVMQRLVFRYHVASLQQDSDKAQRVITELIRLTDAAPTGVESKMVYQLACDTIAQDRILSCTAEDNACRKLQAEACVWYKKILDIRQRQTKTTQVSLWQRPPEKLSLYHLFVAMASDKEHADALLEFNGFRTVFREKLYASFRQYQNESAWTAGTPFTGNLDKTVRGNLAEGWKY